MEESYLGLMAKKKDKNVSNEFLDTNIIYDHIADQESFNKLTAAIISIAGSEKIEITVSDLSFGSINYLLSKLIGKEETIVKLKTIANTS